MTCRCTNKSCTAYAGQCDCRFDGKTQGRAEGIAAAAAWLRAQPAPSTGILPSFWASEMERTLT